MRSDRAKALAILDRDATAVGLELVVREYSDGSGARLMFQPPDEVLTLSEAIVGWNRSAEDIVERGRHALGQAVKAREEAQS